MSLYVINTTKDFNSISDMKGDYILQKNIDFKNVQFKQIGSINNPFEGTFNGNGHNIKNITIKKGKNKQLSIFASNKGKIFDLNIINYCVLGDVSNCNVASLCSVNSGEICGINISGKYNITANKEASNVSLFVNENSGYVQNSIVDIDVKFNSSKKSKFASFINTSNRGLVETLECKGEYILKGDLLLANLFINNARNTLMRACIFSSEFNVLNGEVYREYSNKRQNCNYDGNIYRDNRNSDKLLSKKNLKIRRIPVDYSYKMALIPWSPSVHMSFPKCSCGAKIHATQDFPKDSKQYGLPYTHNNGSLERFMSCFNDDGSLKSYVKPIGYDGYDIYIGNDCSTFVGHALSRIDSDITFNFTWNELPNCNTGTYVVGDYKIKDEEYTTDVINNNGVDVIAEAFAKCHIGDCMVDRKRVGGGHTRIMSHNSVVYRHEDGDIDLVKSYTISNEQGDGLFYRPSIKGQSCLSDHKYAFLTLINDDYIPITTKAIMDSKISKPSIEFVGDDKKDKNSIFNGIVKSNYRILSATIEIKNSKKKTIFDKTIFSGVYANIEYHNDDLNCDSRTIIKEFDLKEFKPFVNEFNLKKNEEYKYSLKVLLNNGKSYLVKRFSFVG